MAWQDGTSAPIGWMGLFTLDTATYRSSPNSLKSDDTSPSFGLIAAPVLACSTGDVFGFWYRYVRASAGDNVQAKLRDPATAYLASNILSLTESADWTYLEFTVPYAANWSLEFTPKLTAGAGKGFWLDDVTLPGPVTGALDVPVSVVTYPAGANGAISVPISVAVAGAAYITGASSIGDPTTGAAVWAVFVELDGVDVSDSVEGDISIEADEGSARIVEFTLRPAPGSAVYFPALTGKQVLVRVADVSTGAQKNSSTLFVGVVDLPSPDIFAGTIKLACSDNYQSRISAMSHEQLKDLIGGYFSPVTFSAGASSWVRSQDLLSTVPVALDISAQGNVRVTPWAAKAVADIRFDEATLLDQSLSIDLAQRQDMTNNVVINFGYRFPRIKAEGYPVSYDLLAQTGTGFGDFVNDANGFINRSQVVSAVEAAGGHVESMTYIPLPTQAMPAGGGMWIPNPYTDHLLCMGFSGIVAFDYAQEIEENHVLTVSSDKSISVVGLMGQTMSGALVGEYPDITAVETAGVLYKKSVISIPPKDTGTVIANTVNATDVTLTDDTNREAANLAMQTLIAIASTKIKQSHRQHSVTAAVPLWPTIDLDKTIYIDTAKVQARGKVKKVRHVLSPSSGAAVSEFTLAISSLLGVGQVHPADQNTAPEGTVAGPNALTGATSVVFKYAATQDKSLTINFPGVEAAERAKAKTTLPKSYPVSIPEELFVINF